jgi:hypothetical protein
MRVERGQYVFIFFFFEVYVLTETYTSTWGRYPYRVTIEIGKDFSARILFQREYFLPILYQSLLPLGLGPP